MYQLPSVVIFQLGKAKTGLDNKFCRLCDRSANGVDHHPTCRFSFSFFRMKPSHGRFMPSWRAPTEVPLRLYESRLRQAKTFGKTAGVYTTRSPMIHGFMRVASMRNGLLHKLLAQHGCHIVQHTRTFLKIATAKSRTIEWQEICVRIRNSVTLLL